jgi:CO/xanthine dehydrogenase Mo-binding subunit
VRRAAAPAVAEPFGAERNAVPVYALPRLRVVQHHVQHAPLRVSALRSLGAFANVFAIESFMDELAGLAGADPLAFRLAHLTDTRAQAVLSLAARKAGWPRRARDGRSGRGLAVARYRDDGAYAAVVADAAVDRRTGLVTLSRVVAAVDAGRIVNPDGAAAQIEGGIIQAASWTLDEAVRFSPDGIVSTSFVDYPILTIARAPKIEVEFVDRKDAPSLGVGEVVLGPTAGAIANAVAEATGRRLREMPFTPDRIKAAVATPRT